MTKYIVCKHENKITVKRSDKNHDFGRLLACCDTLKEAHIRATCARSAFKISKEDA
jgi:hypothetical protein